MAKPVLFAICLALSPSCGLSAEHGSSSESHHHEITGFSAGEPGDPTKPARIVEISMYERAGQMLFAPDRLDVKKGEQIRFVLHNDGELDHEFVLATAQENEAHAETMKQDPSMRHAEANARSLAPKRADEMVWKFTKAGEFEFACLIPGHREAGMSGKVEVE